MTSFLQHICDMTCGSHHSEFINVVDTKVNPTTNKTFITEIDFHIASTYTKGTYESCKNILVPSTGQKALDLMCGHWGSNACNDERWFSFMGDRNTPYVPFPINYIFHNSSTTNDIKPLNATVVPCNESHVSSHVYFLRFVNPSIIFRVLNRVINQHVRV